jgi:predicted transport protein
MTLTYVKPERIWLRDHSELGECWVQDRIAEDPALLGLGDLVLRDKERPQPRAGRLDLLLQDPDSNQRYEVEVQLGKTDEAHVIRTIEYWDIERKRYPQYEHSAVIVAEDITTRFLNVIALFNGAIPLIAIQMQAVKLGDNVSLVCSTVLGEMRLGLVDEDEEVQEVTDRAYWEKRGTKTTVETADELLGIIKTFNTDVELKYNKFYIGLAKNGQPNNFVVFRPKKDWLRMEVRLPRSDETQSELEKVGMDLMDYDARWGRYRINLAKGDVQKQRAFLTEFLKRAHEESV